MKEPECKVTISDDFKIIDIGKNIRPRITQVDMVKKSYGDF